MSLKIQTSLKGKDMIRFLRQLELAQKKDPDTTIYKLTGDAVLSYLTALEQEMNKENESTRGVGEIQDESEHRDGRDHEQTRISLFPDE